MENEVDELAISMVELAKSRTKLFMEETRVNVQFRSIPLKILEETMTLKVISHTQFDVKIEQHPHMKELSVGELMAHHMNEEKKIAKMSVERQQRSLATILKASSKEEMEYYEDITLYHLKK